MPECDATWDQEVSFSVWRRGRRKKPSPPNRAIVSSFDVTQGEGKSRSGKTAAVLLELVFSHRKDVYFVGHRLAQRYVFSGVGSEQGSMGGAL